jgi:hypothetical protein
MCCVFCVLFLCSVFCVHRPLVLQGSKARQVADAARFEARVAEVKAKQTAMARMFPFARGFESEVLVRDDRCGAHIAVDVVRVRVCVYCVWSGVICCPCHRVTVS